MRRSSDGKRNRVIGSPNKRRRDSSGGGVYACVRRVCTIRVWVQGIARVIVGG